jgi:nucleoside 2-deoxyribosyltransferase
MKIYFACSVRAGRDDQPVYAEIIKMLSPYGEVLTKHLGSRTLDTLHNEGGLSDKEIYDRDIKLINEADVLVAEVTTPSHGVGYEIARAEMQGKRVLCLYRETEGKKISVMLTGNEEMKIKNYRELSEVRNILEEFFNGSIKRERE